MRNQLEYIQVIDKYLRGILSEEDTQVFENRLQTDMRLQQEVEKQKILMEAIKRRALKASVIKGKKTYRAIKSLKVIAIFVVLSTVAVFTVFKYGNFNSEFSLGEVKELGIESLPIQGFQINTLTDTVVETENGLVLVIPSDAFETQEGDAVSGLINFEVKEAFDDYAIMKAGLTTTSNGELLETGGMFFLEARQGNKELKLKQGKEIFSQIPNLQPDKNMMLFDGVKQEDGIINWVNPMPFEKDLVTVDITSLDFYPEGYVEELGQTKEKVLVRAEGDLPKRKMTVSEAKQLGLRYPEVWTEKYAIALGLIIREYEDKITKGEVYNKIISDSIYYSFSRLFKCDDIQMTDTSVVSAEKVTRFVRRNFKSEQIKLEDDSTIFKDDDPLQEESEAVATESCPIPSGINPARVRAIWDKKFNNTILATKEFEQRMRVIHESHQDWILEIYLNNLDRPLWFSDSLAMSWELTTKKFRAFYEERKGGVKVNNRLANKLTSYFNRKHKEYTTSSSKAYDTYQTKRNKLKQEYENKRSEYFREEYNRKAKMFLEEYEMNLCDAYRQLDKKGNCKERPVLNPKRAAKLTSRINTLGAKNVDVFVAKATRDRKTLDYTDPRSGKKAVIEYKPMKIKLSNTEPFDKVFMYLLPNNLNSFNRMKTTDNLNFEFALNELLSYKLVGIAYREKQAYLAEIVLVSPKTYTLHLNPVSEEELKKVLSSKKAKVKQEIEADKGFYQEEMNQNKQQKKVEENEKLTLRIGKFLFPAVRERCILREKISYNKFSNEGITPK